jgi:transposase
MNEIKECAMLLHDEQWRELEPLLTGRHGDPGVSGKNNRLFVEAILWIARHNCAWNRLPQHFGKSPAIYMRFRRWNECDLWRQLLRSGIKDRELLLMLERVVIYGDQYTRRLTLRLTRQVKKAAYKATLAVSADIASVSCMLPVEESTLHWVGLVASE